MVERVGNIVHRVLTLQAPQNPIASDLTAEEVQNVELFIRNTPSVVNIANIGESSCREQLHWSSAHLLKCLS